MFGAGLNTFQPKQFATLVRWYDAANPSNNGTRFADGTLVSTWTDVSGTGNATGAGAARPTYKLDQQNGLPGLEYAGAQNMQSASLAVGSNITLFVVSKSSNNTLFLEQSPDLNANNGFYIYGAGGDTTQIKNGGVAISAGTSANWLGTSTNLAMTRYDGANIEAWKNGSVFLSNAAVIGNATVTDTWFLGSRNGASLFMTGYLFEIILYNSALTNAQVAIVNDYLRRKWAIY